MKRPLVLVLVVIASLVAACDPPEERAGDGDDRNVDLGDLALIGLTTEDGCGPLLEWFKSEAAQMAKDGVVALGTDAVAGPIAGRATAATGAAGAGADQATAMAESSAPPVASGEYSTTNIQEEGVDEPDLVKTDGRRLVTIAGGHVRLVDLTGDSPALRASVPVAGAHTLFLVGDRVVVIGGAPMGGVRPMPMPGPAVDVIAPGGAGATEVTTIDISDLDAPEVEETVRLDGSYVAARLVDGVARLVLRWSPHELYRKMYETPGTDAAAVVAGTSIDDWKPDYVACDQVHHQEGFTGPDTVSVVTIDPADPRPGNGAAITGAGETVYASRERLYVTGGRWGNARPSTAIHAFDISDEVTTRYVASGSVEGMLLNQFSMSEHDGVLRVATTTSDATGMQTESQVVTLRQEGPELKQVGHLGGLGKTERIYAVRFLGETGYVVTFRQTDPLYVIDLADPAKPEMKGELKIPGFSAYLHPIGDGRLLGIGQNATDDGRRLGSQLSLFDVSDPAAPKQLATHDLQSYSSAAEYDHHAFLWWPKEQLVVVPTESDDAMVYRPGAIGVTVDGNELKRRGRITQALPMPITRSVVVGDSLLTLSEVGMRTSDVTSFADQGWLAF